MLGLANIYRYRKSTLFFILISCALYLWFAYDLVRTDNLQIILVYILLFVFAFLIIKTSGFNTSSKLSTGFKILVISAILFRLLFLLAVPNLSPDFYRFIWDGQMIIAGFNPYLTTPSYQMELGIISNFPNQAELYNGLSELNASHFSNYPPLNQLCFVIGNLFPGNSILSSVIGMRLIIIAADIGTLYFGKKLLERLKLPPNRIFWYILNPFIIIELTGNLHFEGVMIFFLVWSLYLLHLGKWKWAAVAFACSVSVKLIPLMFLPLFFWWFYKPSVISRLINKSPESLDYDLGDNTWKLNISKLITFYSIFSITVILLFLPFFSMKFINNYTETVGLWFGNFEFNASLYYLAREIGYAITGYNEIAIIGKILPVITLIIILVLSFFRENNTLLKLITAMLLAFTCYLFFSTTVHPWYLATLVLLCVFTKYRFPLVWSLAIILSYSSYLGVGNSDKSESLWIIGLEYLIVFTAFTWEVFLKKRLPVT